MVIILIGGLVATAAFAVYLLVAAVRLKTTAESLQAELRQFKEGGFDRLISEKLGVGEQLRAQERAESTQRIEQLETERLAQEQKAATLVNQFMEGLGAVKRQLMSLEQLQGTVGELNDLLKPQQLRGELGEVIVRTLLADKLPRGQYEENHTFANGKQVEFVIKLNDKLIAIDSKLQLEGYKRLREAPEERKAALRTEFKRTIKQKIDEVKEYIRPTEGTYNFALMVIPSEAVYYDVVANKDFVEPNGLYDYAREQNVFLVSPLTFWAYLTALAHGLHGLEIERHAEDILARLNTLTDGLSAWYEDEFKVLGGHLRNAANKYTEAKEHLEEIQGDLHTLKRLEVAA